ncbi:hypothetical protein CSCA_3258 [Clostridium scatologenes]|uniref:Uncharacterized protein n=1 Tax=Clostridium scatologenes TaxID=1548 RepID=A0A0E3K1Z0_CLOSL|nr:hypothetical protein CSCA_3258 [Clostridium scatologenes]
MFLTLKLIFEKNNEKDYTTSFEPLYTALTAFFSEDRGQLTEDNEG